MTPDNWAALIPSAINRAASTVWLERWSAHSTAVLTSQFNDCDLNSPMNGPWASWEALQAVLWSPWPCFLFCHQAISNYTVLFTTYKFTGLQQALWMGKALTSRSLTSPEGLSLIRQDCLGPVSLKVCDRQGRVWFYSGLYYVLLPLHSS